MKRWLIIVSMVWIVLGCHRQQRDVVRYVNGKQVLNMNTLSRDGRLIDSINLKMSVPDTVLSGEELHAQIYLENKSYRIADAFYNCRVNEMSLVDTVSRRIVGCKDGLVVENDTVEIYFVAGSSSGWKEFFKITVLSIDSLGVYRYHQGTFKYFVK